MAILTNEIESTSGLALVDGRDINDPASQLSIGYCPQTDPVRLNLL